MDISQWIGLFVGFGAVAFLLIQQIREMRYRRQHPQKYAEEHFLAEKRRRQLLKVLEIEQEEEQEFEKERPRQQRVSAASRLPKVMNSSVGKMTHMTHRTPTQEVQYAPDYHKIVRIDPSRASQLLTSLPSRQEMILLHAIIGPPKSLSDEY
jgi:hypothetical protein